MSGKVSIDPLIKVISQGSLYFVLRSLPLLKVRDDSSVKNKHCHVTSAGLKSVPSKLSFISTLLL